MLDAETMYLFINCHGDVVAEFPAATPYLAEQAFCDFRGITHESCINDYLMAAVISPSIRKETAMLNDAARIVFGSK